jgi:glycosyltransferase involved in cell wall biosynthesis
LKSVPKVSVIIPCYNAEETILETLSTVSNQDFHDYEVLVIDDGSTDNTASLLKEWAKSHSNFRVIEIPHAGVIVAFNKGLKLAKGTYIARMDADDTMTPNRLSLQVDYLDTHPKVGLVASLVKGFPKESVREGFQIYIDWQNTLVTHQQIIREIYIESPFCNPSVMIRKDILDSFGGYQGFGWAEDYDLWLRMHLAGVIFGKIPQKLVSWREHPNRLTRVDPRYSVENFIRAKTHYLMEGPLKSGRPIFIWGSGMNGKRISKYLVRKVMPIIAFIDIDPKKIGSTRRGYPIVSVDDFQTLWKQYENPILLSAVAARGARKLIRAQLKDIGLIEGQDWFGVA